MCCRSVLVLALSLAVPALLPCSAATDKPVDPQTVAALAVKADVAPAREQCFLYAELVHQMTELAGKQMTAGEDASLTLKAVRSYAEKIHVGMAQDTKRLKNAQILMEHTAYRLNEILHSAAADDRPGLEATLKQLNQVQGELDDAGLPALSKRARPLFGM